MSDGAGDAGGSPVLGLMRLPGADRGVLVDRAAADMGMAPAIVEKDLWVCYTLDLLFHRFEYSGGIVFKGGTSLSKCFGLIQRFSEDIDLILDWRLLGYSEDEPWEPRSNSAQERFKADSIARTEAFLAGDFAPRLREAISGELGIEARVYPGAAEETVVFEYPREREIPAALDVIKLEVGPMAAWSPSQEAAITPYAAGALPGAICPVSTTVRTASPERTFWEKATILHKEAMRTNGRLPDRYARHYYDLHMMCSSPVKDAALADLGLLDQVVEFKMRFWRSNAARYDLCRPGTFRLVPPDDQMRRVRDDYDRMRRMIFGEVPDFEDVMRSIANLEAEINALP